MERFEATTVNLPTDTEGRASARWCSSEGAARRLFGRGARDCSFGRPLRGDLESSVVPGARIRPADLLFVNGRRHDGAHEIGSLADAVRVAGARRTLKG
jgi:hypothetical protein